MAKKKSKVVSIPLIIGLILMAIAVVAVTGLAQRNTENRGQASESSYGSCGRTSDCASKTGCKSGNDNLCICEKEKCVKPSAGNDCSGPLSAAVCKTVKPGAKCVNYPGICKRTTGDNCACVADATPTQKPKPTEPKSPTGTLSPTITAYPTSITATPTMVIPTPTLTACVGYLQSCNALPCCPNSGLKCTLINPRTGYQQCTGTAPTEAPQASCAKYGESCFFLPCCADSGLKCTLINPRTGASQCLKE